MLRTPSPWQQIRLHSLKRQQQTILIGTECHRSRRGGALGRRRWQTSTSVITSRRGNNRRQNPDSNQDKIAVYRLNVPSLPPLQVPAVLASCGSLSLRVHRTRVTFFVSSYFCCKDSPLLNYLRSCIWGWYVKSFVTRSSSDGADTCFFTSELSVIISQSFHIHEYTKLSTQYHHSHSQHQTLSSHLSPHL